MALGSAKRGGKGVREVAVDAHCTSGKKVAFFLFWGYFCEKEKLITDFLRYRLRVMWHPDRYKG